ncbi:Eukaryotic translation initiation factor 4E-binding protein 3 [Saguinus oedipus]|uniref:Eukaryotic translation initiation factor 4E-binding protein 3 n=1 Tax=Saguinus oedipus TaxID=9490 RepID=A0ABQ9W5B9_SAGOE|nr:Eukaryotic translation initiation factor 4E-binding protein 3 [Saguinus oedipus]
MSFDTQESSTPPSLPGPKRPESGTHHLCTQAADSYLSPNPLTGTRIIYDRKFLLECKNSPIARTPPCCLPQIPEVTTPPTAPPSKLEELKEQETEEEIPDDAQFEMDI